MPELPEVETVTNGLRKLLKIEGRKNPILQSVELNRKTLRTVITPKLGKLKDLPILSITRRAKFILWQTKDGIILNHLGMTGKWRKLESSSQFQKHDQFGNPLLQDYPKPHLRK